MKKITILIIAEFIVITSANIQTMDKVNKTVFWVYDKGEWVVNKRNYLENIYVVRIENDIRISNETDSRYITYGDSRKEKTDRYESDKWDAKIKKWQDEAVKITSHS